MNNPKISVIIAVYNGNSKQYNIQRTIESVMSQTYKNWELVIIDGGSTDGTIELIKEYDKKNKLGYWVSEKDKGIFDALNKGVKNAKGDILYFICSDDFLYSNDIFEKVVREFEKGVDLVCGAILIKKDKGYLKTFTPFSRFKLIQGRPPANTATFFGKKCFEDKEFDINYPIVADLDLYCHCSKKRFSAKNLKDLIVNEYGIDGYSANNSPKKQADKIILKNYGPVGLFIRKLFAIIRTVKSPIGKKLTKLKLYKSKNVFEERP